MAIIAVDGPTGVGKSTTARAIATRLDAELVLDPVSVSPLLDTYYTGEAKPAAALEAELAFLRSRAGLLTAAATSDIVVADFSLMRTAPFAEFLDDPDDRATVLAEMRSAVDAGPSPTVLVLLTATPTTLFARVRARQRAAESTLTLDHLELLHERFARWHDPIVAQAAHVIELDTHDWDPRDPADLSQLVDRIRAALPSRDLTD